MSVNTEPLIVLASTVNRRQPHITLVPHATAGPVTQCGDLRIVAVNVNAGSAADQTTYMRQGGWYDVTVLGTKHEAAEWVEARITAYRGGDTRL